MNMKQPTFQKYLGGKFSVFRSEIREPGEVARNIITRSNHKQALKAKVYIKDKSAIFNFQLHTKTKTKTATAALQHRNYN